MSPPRKDLSAARALARAAQTGESLAEVAKAEGISKTKLYEERARLASLPKGAPATALVEVSAFEDLSAVPHDAAIEESLQLAARTKQRAEAMGDLRVALVAQQHMDRIRGIGQPSADAIPRGEFASLMQGAASALAPWPEALEAFKTAVRTAMR